MSLTSEMSKNKYNNEFYNNVLKLPSNYIECFQTISKNKPFSNEYINYVPYSNTTQKLYDNRNKSDRNKSDFLDLTSFIGHTFDYMARIKIAKYIYNGNDFFNNFIPNNNYVEENIIQIYGNNEENKSVFRKKYQKCIEIIDNYINNRKQYSLKGIIRVCFFLSNIEEIYRNGTMYWTDIIYLFPNDTWNRYNQDIIDEISKMVNVFEEKFINSGLVKKDSLVIFNPTFSETPVIGKADADIFIDGTLYDFKTNKSPIYYTQYNNWDKDFKQIYGYYLLLQMSNKRNIETSFNNEQITRLAFYKARFGEIEYIDISKISQQELEDSISKINNYGG